MSWRFFGLTISTLGSTLGSITLGFLFLVGTEALAQAASADLPQAYWLRAMQAPAPVSATMAAVGTAPDSDGGDSGRDADWPIWAATVFLILAAAWLHSRLTPKERIVLHTDRSHLGVMRSERSRPRALTVQVVRQNQSNSTSEGPIRMP